MRLLELEKNERIKQTKEIRDEYERAMKVNNDLKEVIIKNRTQNTEMTAKLKLTMANVSALSTELHTSKDAKSAQETKFDSLTKAYEQKIADLEHSSTLSNKQVECLRSLIVDQNDQLAALKDQTEQAITAREITNQAHIRKISDLEAVIRYHTQRSNAYDSYPETLEKKKSPVAGQLKGKYVEFENRGDQHSDSLVRPLKDRTNANRRYC